MMTCLCVGDGFFFQAEDGIRDYKVTGVQTCALPIYQIRNKQSRTQACREAYAAVKAGLTAQGVEFDGVKVEGMLFDIEARIVRSQILAGEPRIDGRDTRTVRPIEIRNRSEERRVGKEC